MNIPEQLRQIRNQLPASVTLVAVSKTQAAEVIMEAYQCGQYIFGENRVQELLAKQAVLPPDIRWHLIGHLQTNKVKFIAPFIAMIQSVDSLRLLREIDKEAARNHRIIPCLLEFHIASEETKFGLDLSEAEDLLLSAEYRDMKHVRIDGVMGMASFSDDRELVGQEFSYLVSVFETLKHKFFPGRDHFREISMGMSSDYELAVSLGSTMVRIGSSLFGSR